MTEGNAYIPQELLKMLELPYGYSLLLKGDGGVGKSTLAFELLVKTKGKNATYLSTRVAPDQLFEHFPWVHDEVEHDIAVIDATQTGLTMNNPLKEEQLALKFDGMPDLLRILVEMADQATGPVFIVIDSWDALQLTFQHIQVEKHANKPQLTEDLNYMYNVFMGLVRQKNIKLILVAENVSEMDYLVDAVVELRREYLPNNKMIRVAELKKSRGIRINNQTYLFTLEEGRFKTFFPWDVKILNDFKTMPLALTFKDIGLQLSLDTILSSEVPVQFGNIAIEATHPEFMTIIIESLARYEIRNDGLFTFTPPDTFDIMAFKRKMLAFLDEQGIEHEQYYKNIKIHLSTTFPLGSVADDENVMQLGTAESDGSSQINTPNLLEKYEERFASYPDGHEFTQAVHFGWLDALKTVGSNLSDIPRDFFSVIKKNITKANSIYIAATYSDDPLLKELRRNSMFSIEMLFYRGTPIINIISPQNPSIYGLLFSLEQGQNFKNFEVYPIV